MSSWSFERLESLRAQVERAPKSNHIAILRILNDSGGVQFSENAGGTMVNLSEVSDSALEKVEQYVRCMRMQEDALEAVERQKEEFRSTLRPI